MAQIDAIVCSNSDTEAEKDSALVELSQALCSMETVNGAGYSTCNFVATAFTANEKDAPILDTGASTNFVTSDEYIINPHKKKTPISTANVKSSFTKSSGKYKITETSQPVYLPTLPAPDFRQNIINVGQLAIKNNVLFTKEGCYLLVPSAAPVESHIIGVRDPDNLYRKKKEYREIRSRPLQRVHE